MIAPLIFAALVLAVLSWVLSGVVLTRLRGLVVAALWATTLATGALTIAVMGHAKPVGLEWAARTLPEAKVIAAVLREPEAIYLWLELQPGAPPVAYVLPWDRETAEQLQGAEQQAEETGTGVMMARPFESGPRHEDEPRFYPEPVPALPVKEKPAGAMIYEP